MRITKRIFIVGVLALVVSLLFFGVHFPASEFTGCYVARDNQDKLCIYPDNTVVQYAYNKEKWNEYHRSTWTATPIEQRKTDWFVVRFKTAIENDTLKNNVVVQPYKGLFGQVRISINNDFNKAESNVIYNLVD